MVQVLTCIQYKCASVNTRTRIMIKHTNSQRPVSQGENVPVRYNCSLSKTFWFSLCPPCHQVVLLTFYHLLPLSRLTLRCFWRIFVHLCIVNFPIFLLLTVDRIKTINVTQKDPNMCYSQAFHQIAWQEGVFTQEPIKPPCCVKR